MRPGKLNHDELRETLNPFIRGAKIRYHNSLLLGMMANVSRDSPTTDVGVWVSASDKPSSNAKMPAGDVNERRLKKEVMAISARERRRIKEVPDPVSSSAWLYELICTDMAEKHRRGRHARMYAARSPHGKADQDSRSTDP